jgi:hypothetical protein
VIIEKGALPQCEKYINHIVATATTVRDSNVYDSDIKSVKTGFL